MTATFASLVTLAQASGSELTEIATPTIDWSALWPGICLALGGILLLTIASLAKRWLFEGFYALFAAVSYTHLDVYKRQTCTRTSRRPP